MWSSKRCKALFIILTQVLAASTASHQQRTKCKATPGSPDWPGDASWAALNQSISGRLLRPAPPGAVCHPGQPTYNAAACLAVQAGWLTVEWHTENPISTLSQNVNNNSCLPEPSVPCSGEGYPIFVINATTSDHVKKGIDFARENNVRLIVKGTGHDSMGR